MATRKNYKKAEPKEDKPKGRSGAKWCAITKGENKGNFLISAWKYTKRFGLLKVLIFPYSKTHIRTSETGREWENWICKIEGLGRPTELIPCIVDRKARMAIVNKYSWVVNTKAKNGGYCGTFINKD